ncbi:MAG: methyltransferase domain-containing protein [Candidatus Aminicenantes bacterium]|nr:methyltransferase domain-containing protein [Candidatus Aminicenantes bacterium]
MPEKKNEATAAPWQLKMFNRSLKKKMKVAALARHFPPLAGRRCLLVTCGDNNGAINYKIRAMGGSWTWADFEAQGIAGMEELLGETVVRLDRAAAQLPFADGEFDLAVSVDVHEHLEDPLPVTRELARVTRAGGTVILTTPNGNERKLAVRIKKAVGMDARAYGHRRTGFDLPDLRRLAEAAGLTFRRGSSYARFFTEMLELAINFMYVKVLAKKSAAPVEEGTIAPVRRDQLEAVKKSYRAYSIVYPFFWIVSRLDYLVAFTRGYAVVLEAGR